MTVLFFAGKHTKNLIVALKRLHDEVDFVTYDNVSDFIKDSKLRNLYVNRMVFLDKFMPNGEQDYIALNEYLREYSSDTELVLITSANSPDEGLFNKYFFSNMYSPVITSGKVSVDFFKELISESVLKIRAKYYTLDKKDLSAKTSQASNKIGKIGEFKGGVAKNPKDEEVAPQSNNGSQVGSNAITGPSNSPEDNGSLNGAEDGYNGVGFGVISGSNEIGVNGNSVGSEIVSGSYGAGYSNPEFSSDADEEEDLSLGEFGQLHSDTDTFDEDEEGDAVQELEDYANNQRAQQAAFDSEEQRRIQEANRLKQEALIRQQEVEEAERHKAEQDRLEAEQRAKQEAEQRVMVEAQQGQEEKEPLSMESESNVYVYTGLCESNISQNVVDEAGHLADAGKSVLIIDLSSNHELLSFINTKSFYQSPKTGSFVEYAEDGVRILSPGYGCSATQSDIAKLLCKQSISKYDAVYVDCPITDLKSLTDVVDSPVNYVLNVNNDASSFINLSVALQNRSFVSLHLERKLQNTARVHLNGRYFEQDHKIALGIVYFANGCWLSRLQEG